MRLVSLEQEKQRLCHQRGDAALLRKRLEISSRYTERESDPQMTRMDAEYAKTLSALIGLICG